MWRGLISGCVQSCGWPQRIPGKQQNLQNWVCCNLPSGSRSRFLWGRCFKFHLQSKARAAAENRTLTIWEERRGTWPSGACPHKTSTFPPAKPREDGTLLKLGVLMIQLYLKQCHTHKGRFDSTERKASYAPDSQLRHWGRIILCVGAVLWTEIFSRVPGHYPVNVSTLPLPTVVTTLLGTMLYSANPSATLNNDSSLTPHTRQINNVPKADKLLLDTLQFFTLLF